MLASSYSLNYHIFFGQIIAEPCKITLNSIISICKFNFMVHIDCAGISECAGVQSNFCLNSNIWWKMTFICNRRGAHNMWSLNATRTLIIDRTYRILSHASYVLLLFGVYLLAAAIGIMVFQYHSVNVYECTECVCMCLFFCVHVLRWALYINAALRWRQHPSVNNQMTKSSDCRFETLCARVYHSRTSISI